LTKLEAKNHRFSLFWNTLCRSIARNRRLYRPASNATETLALSKEKCLFSDCLIYVSVHCADSVSELVWKRVPDSGSGDGRVCYVDGVVRRDELTVKVRVLSLGQSLGAEIANCLRASRQFCCRGLVVAGLCPSVRPCICMSAYACDRFVCVCGDLQA